ncbi:MAG: hypothetical protein K6U14_06775 [Firmicutes bacterium]|nr:hypothetical protein [Alicyclobacillaceae bacterium]MCL6497325.1 hypothetical protein [Bacillota bacterium]
MEGIAGAMPPMAISVVVPPGYIHAEAYLPVAQTLFKALCKLGLSCEWWVNRIEPGRVAVLFGAHLLDAATICRLPSNTILFNLEQFDPANPSPWFTPAYRQALHTHVVWDYSRYNTQALAQTDFAPPQIHWVPLGTVDGSPAIEVPRASVQDIDVLFYGSLNSRRLKPLRDMEALGLRVKVLSGVYGAERDRWIARAKVVVNIHFYETALFEWPRVLPLLMSGVPVISEWSQPMDLDGDIVKIIQFSSYDTLPLVAKDVVGDGQMLSFMASAGIRYAIRRDQARLLLDSIFNTNYFYHG